MRATQITTNAFSKYKLFITFNVEIFSLILFIFYLITLNFDGVKNSELTFKIHIKGHCIKEIRKNVGLQSSNFK